jgi:putative transcriptional regulator
MLNRISEVLLEKNLKQIDLAHELGVVKSTVSMWCSNTSQPPLGKLALIAEVLDCDLAELLATTKQTKKRKKINS